jgi:hypothetical protein
MPRRTELAPPPTFTPYELGLFVGLLIGEGHFGGDGRKAQITLRMHVDHRGIFEWLVARVPGGRLYGPYHHDGRSYYQWMVRGPYLQHVLVPLLDPLLTTELDERVASRYADMKRRYRLGP